MVRAMIATLGLLSLLAVDVDAGAPALDLLRQATVRQQRGVSDVARMTDGVAPTDGDNWKTAHTAIIAPDGVVEWDLGELRHVGAARIQADNNDLYIVTGSTDGTTWAPLWRADAVEIPGMQTRTTEALSAEVRYVRLTAEGGDKMYSVGELELFPTPAAMAATTLRRMPLPPPPKAVPPPPIDSGLLVVLGVAGLGAWFLASARRRNLKAQATSEKSATAGDAPPSADEKPEEKPEEKKADAPKS